MIRVSEVRRAGYDQGQQDVQGSVSTAAMPLLKAAPTWK